MKITGVRTYKFSVPTGQGIRDLLTAAARDGGLREPDRAWATAGLGSDHG